MRLPIPFLLYLTALALFAWAGWTVYESLPLWDQQTRSDATTEGSKTASGLIADGKGQQPLTSDWNYGARPWWDQFKQLNLIGKLPERKPTPAEIAAAQEAEQPKVDMTPLEDVFELVSLVCSTESGDDIVVGTHVVIRYKAADVEPPEWWVRENSPPTAGGAGRVMPGPRDLAAAPPNARTTRPNQRPDTRLTRPQPTAMPTSGGLGGQEVVQTLWLGGDDEGRHSDRLWPPYDHIRLVRVAPDAQSAFFVRELPPPKEGEPAPEPQEEELLKTTADIPQDVLQSLRNLRGGEGPRTPRVAAEPKADAGGKWRDVETTTRYGNQFHIGRQEERRFRENADDFFNSVYVDTYVSKFSNTRGLSVRNIEPKIASSFGVQTGDVLIEINGKKVESKAQAVNLVKKDYKRGVRTFTTSWLSNGQRVERVYQAPDK